MNSEKLIKAIGMLDDKVLEGTQIEAEDKILYYDCDIKKNKLPYIKIIAMVASVAVVFIIMAIVKSSLSGSVESNNEPFVAVVDNTASPENTELVEITETEIDTPSSEIPSVNLNGTEEINGAIRESESNKNAEQELQYTEKPMLQNTKAPVTVEPVETKVPENQDEEDIKETVTETPLVTEVPKNEGKWTDTFIVSNAEYSLDIENTDTWVLAEQLYYSEYSNTSNKTKDWWYGVKYNDCVYTQAELAVAIEYIECHLGEAVLKGVNTVEYLFEETKAYVYKISGVSNNAAIAVKIDEQEGYYLFINPDYKAESFNEFVASYNLRDFAKLRSIAIYEQNGIYSSENIDDDSIWDILTSDSSYAVDYKKLYYECKLVGSIKMDVSIYGCKSVPIALFDEGYVVIYLGNANGAYYVGQDKIALIKARINNSK